jgi:CHAT domain-containing protein
MADKSLAFVISKGGVNRVELPVSEQQLSAAIQEFRSFPTVSEAGGADTAQLYGWLIAPVASYLKTPLVTIVPHASLHYLPFAALADGTTSFGEQHTISYLPSASALKFVSSRPISRGSVLALSMARSEGMPILRFADDEARTVAALYGVHPLLGEEATETALATRASDASILHIAAHAELNANAPLFSRILLKGDARSDGSLELREIYDLALHETALVVLCACATQVGPGSAGDDLVTLNRAFLYAGASAVVASLWKVDDPATALFMKSFHTYVSNGRGKAAALSAAQADVRAKYPHPYYWSAFVLTGDPN